jgi:hypothetical protein
MLMSIRGCMSDKISWQKSEYKLRSKEPLVDPMDIPFYVIAGFTLFGIIAIILA